MSTLAQIIMTISDDGYRHVQVRTEGATNIDALRCAEAVLSDLAKDKEAFIRVAPEAEFQRDLITGVTKGTCYTRFSYKNSPGEWQVHPRPESCDLLGIAADHG